MENELKMMMSKYNKDYTAVDWTTLPLPSVGEQKKTRPLVSHSNPSLPKDSSLGRK